MASTHVARVSAGGVTNRRIAPSIYYTCSTAADTAAKTITTDSTNKWTSADLFEGLTIFVKFTNNNTSTNPTLNIDSIGAKPIYKYGTTVPGTSAASSWNANSIVGLTYDTTLNNSGCWVMHDWNNTTYSALSQSDATAGTSTTSRLITAKVLNDTIDGKISNLGGGTVTSITLKAGNGINLDTDDTAITTSGSRTISHADTSSQTSSSNNGRTYIQSVTLDDYGHVTGLSTATEDVTNTDTKLQVAAITSGTTYYPIVGTGTTAATRQYDTTGLKYIGTNGTTSQLGKATLTLGNSTAAGTANNKSGELALYGASQYYTTLKSYDLTTQPTANRTITLPDKSGTVALTSDIPDTSSFITDAGVTKITTTAGTHTAITNSTGAVSFNVPTKTSHLTNDSGFITTDNDTKNTAGSTDSSSKLFLVGATSQAANPQTYSQDTAYVGTDGHLYSNSKQVVNLSDSQALTNKTYNGYTLAAASAKAVDTSISVDSSSTNLPTSAAVATYVKEAEEISISSTEPTGSNTKIWIRI